MDFENSSWLLAPFEQLLDPSFRMAYVYLLSSLLVALLAYMVEKARRGEADQVSLLRWVLPSRVLRHPSAQVDLAYYLINKALIAAIYGSLAFTTPLTFQATVALLESVFGPSNTTLEPHLGWSILTTVVIILVLDFTLWYLHYIFHKVPFLWDYHKVHHSAEVMTPLTAARMHPLEEAPAGVIAAFAIGGTYGVLHHLLGTAAIQIQIFEINIILAVFYFSAFHLRHSHVWVRYPYWLQHILVCPAQHQIHHSVDRKHWDKNMGFIFAFWDWMAGTLYAPKDREELTFGLGTEEDGGKWHNLGALYFLPLRQSWERLRNRRNRRDAPPTEPAE
jgi:sterol desaturase/sphingolipid hydroxylase (fatty acid hydroxylase superfamily)